MHCVCLRVYTACVDGAFQNIIACNPAHERSVEVVRSVNCHQHCKNKTVLSCVPNVLRELRFLHLFKQNTSQQVFLRYNYPFTGCDVCSICTRIQAFRCCNVTWVPLRSLLFESYVYCGWKSTLFKECCVTFLMKQAPSEREKTSADPHEDICAKMLVLIGTQRHPRQGKTEQLCCLSQE